MAKNDLQKLDESVKSQHKYWESLSPEKRRETLIQTRNDLLKNAQKYIFFLAIIGLLFSVITINLWVTTYKMNLMSSLGVFCGTLLAGAGFYYINLNKIKSSRKIQSDKFTDDDAIAYFREQEMVNQRALEQWNRKGKYILAIGTMLVFLLFFRSTVEFAFILLASRISVFLIGLVISFFVQKILNNIEIKKQNGG